jgi:hypothetical protein
MNQITITAKIPVAWLEPGTTYEDNKGVLKTVGPAGKCRSEDTKIVVNQIDGYEDFLSNVANNDEQTAVILLNGWLAAAEKDRVYQAKLSAVKPSDLPINVRRDRAVAAMAKVGFSLVAARKVVDDQIASGSFEG